MSTLSAMPARRQRWQCNMRKENIMPCVFILAFTLLLLWLVDLPRSWKDGMLYIQGYHQVVMQAKEYTPAAVDTSDFVRVKDGLLYHRGAPFYFAGFNNYFMMMRAADPHTRQNDVLPVFESAKAMNLSVMRMWAFSDGDDWNALQVKAGQLDERVLRDGLDWVVAESAARGLKLILVLTNYDPAFGGAERYVQWAGGSSISEFYTSSSVKAMFKDYIATILHRRNSISGVLYKDDPNILAWELINEPLNPGDDTGDVFHAWLEEMVGYVKSLDPYHLLTVGYHGFYGASTPDKWKYNPSYGGWLSPQPVHYDAVCEGVDFLRNHNLSGVDMLNLHVWADNWLQCNQDCKMQWTEEWVSSHIDDAVMLGKPVVFGEVGHTMDGRARYFHILLSQVEKAIRKGQPIAGTLLWMLGSPSYPNYDGYTINPHNLTSLRPDQPRPTSYFKEAAERAEFRNWHSMMQCLDRRSRGHGSGINTAQHIKELQHNLNHSVQVLAQHAAWVDQYSSKGGD